MEMWGDENEQCFLFYFSKQNVYLNQLDQLAQNFSCTKAMYFSKTFFNILKYLILNFIFKNPRITKLI